MKEPNLPPGDGGNRNIPDENSVEPQSSIENRALTESSFSDFFESFFIKMKPLVMQYDTQLAHYQQLKENHHELEDDFQKLEIKYQKQEERFFQQQHFQKKYQQLQTDYNLLFADHEQLEKKYQLLVQKTNGTDIERSKKLESVITTLQSLFTQQKQSVEIQKTTNFTHEEMELITMEGYFEISDYYEARKRFYRPDDIQSMKKILRKKSKEMGYLPVRVNTSGTPEYAYCGYVLKAILHF